MKNMINKKVLIFSILIIVFEQLNAQNIDNSIKKLLEQQNWFGLDKEYHQKGNTINSPELKWLTEALLNIKFNQSNAAISSIDTLLHKYQEEIGFANSVELFRYKISLLDNQGEYDYAANELENFIDQVSQNVPHEELKEFETMYSIQNSLRHEEKPTIIKPEKNVEIPFGTMEMNFTIKKDYDIIEESTTTLGLVKASIQGKEYIFILDTGFEKTCCIFNNISKDINLHYLTDTINLSGVGISQGKLAILDSISLGGIYLYNSLIVISDNFLEKSDAFGNNNIDIHGLLGMDFIKRIGEIQLYPRDKKIIIPWEESELPTSGRNIILDKRNSLIIKSLNEDGLITFHLDTGNSNSLMFKSYYLKNKDVIERKLEKRSNSSFGVGSSFKSHTTYQMPLLTQLIGDTSFSLKNLPIYTVNSFVEDPNADGSLGMDFINKFSKITLNMNKMFIQLEK